MELGQDWQSQIELLVRGAESVLQYEKKIQSAVHALRKKLMEKEKDKTKKEKLKAVQPAFFACPSGVGLHVSIGKCALGIDLPFTVERVLGYDNQSVGKPSQWDSSKLVARTIALKVDFGDASIEQVNSTHIAIAAVGFQSIALP